MPESTINTVNKGTTASIPNEEPQKLLFFNYHETCLENYALLGHNDDIHETPLVITHFPNHYVPPNSPEFTNTRIVRIPRAFTTSGLPYPEFSDVLPGREAAAIIDDDQTFVIKGTTNGQWFGMSSFSPLSLYLSDAELKEIMDQVNSLLRKSYETTVWNLVGAILNMLSFWLLFHIIKTKDKRHLEELEDFVTQQNKTLENRGIKIISPRRSAYLSLDFQIPKPVPEETG